MGSRSFFDPKFDFLTRVQPNENQIRTENSERIMMEKGNLSPNEK